MFKRDHGRELSDRQIMEARVLGGPVGAIAPIDLNYRLTSPASIGATQTNVNRVLNGLTSQLGYLGMSPFTIDFEIRKAISIYGDVVSWANALAYDHAASDPVLWLDAPIFNVKHFAAKGDDSADDYLPVQRALDQADSIGGGIVLSPEGKYRFGTGLTIGDNTLLLGQGNTVFKRNAAGMTLITNKDTSGGNSRIGIQNIRFNGVLQSSDTTGGPEILFQKVTDFFIQECTFETIPRNAIYNNTCVDYRVLANRFNDIGAASHVSSGVNIGTAILNYDCDGGVIGFNNIYNCWQMAIIYSVLATAAEDGIIVGNTCEDLADNGIRVQNPSTKHVIVANNTVRDAEIDCIRLNGQHNICVGNTIVKDATAVNVGIKSDYGLDCIVANNSILDCPVGIQWRLENDNASDIAIIGNHIVGGNRGIVVSRVGTTEVMTDFQIVGNYVRGTTASYGFDIQDVTGLLLNGNYAVENAADGIRINGCYNVSIAGNVCRGNGSSGIRVDTCGVVALGINQCDGNTNHGIVVVSTDDVNLNGNVCATNNKNGILLTTVADAIIGGNMCKDNNDNAGDAEDGIQLSSVNNAIIFGNRCYDDRGTKYQKYGLRHSNCDTLHIFGNNFAGNASGEISATSGTNIHTYDLETQTANPDTSGATLGELETEVNQLKSALRTVGVIAP